MNDFPKYPLDSRLLRHFLAVVEHGNMTAAAASLGLTQPAPRGVPPPHAGGALPRHARLIESSLRAAAEEIDAIRRGTAATIQVGASPLWASWLLPDAVAALERELPRTRVRVLGGVLDTLVPSLQRGELDL